MAATATEERRDSSLLVLVGMLLVSVGAHAVSLWLIPNQREAKRSETIEMMVYEKPKPPPPPVEEKKEEPPPPPKVEPPKPKLKPPPVKLDKPLPPPPVDAPPPPNDAPPPDAKPAPVMVGISLSSTTTGASNFAVPVGNTAYGKADKANNPADVKPYAAPVYVPPGGADTDPVALSEVKVPYPEEAKKNGQEGTVRLKLKIDAEGNVVEVTVISGPGYGLNEAARDALKRFKFKPATKGGSAVGTTIVYNYTFLLDE